MTGALIRFAYPRARLGRGLALNALVVAGSTAAAPSIASAILAVAHWEWLFAINVPIGLVCFAVAWRALPLSPHSAMRFDIVSALLSALSFGVGMVGIMGLTHGHGLPLAIAELAVGVISGVLLVRRQLSRSEPLLARRPAPDPAVPAVDHDLDLLLLRADAGFHRHPVLRPGQSSGEVKSPPDC